MKSLRAVYAASLDPITNGHCDVIERVARMFDELVVIVAIDPRKSYTFSADERVLMAEDAVAHLANVRVTKCSGRYVVKCAEELEARVVVRGIRNYEDLEYERVLAEENYRICPGIETLFLPCRPELMHVSSGMVRAHVGMDPDWEAQVARSVPQGVVARLKRRHIERSARAHWDSLMASLNVRQGADEVYARLAARYAEPHRASHSLEHIVTLLDELARIGAGTPALIHALFYHDAVYDTHAHDNEEQSVVLARADGRTLGLPEGLLDESAHLINATKHAALPTDPAPQLIVDLDLMILGCPAATYDRYALNIRKEYAWVGQPEYVQGRSAVLRGLLERHSIFCTEPFRARFEAQARSNIERELAALSLR